MKKLLTLLLVLLVRQAAAADVGFQVTTLPSATSKPLDVGIWYPTDVPSSPHRLGPYVQHVAPDAAVLGQQLPLVVISHGSGGWFGAHHDTAEALAHAGFVVAALTHRGDSVDDISRQTEVERRPAQLKQLIDYMLQQWPQRGRLDADHVGAFGFSAGGFTVLVASGAAPDLSTVAPYCKGHPSTETCVLVKASPETSMRFDQLPPSTWVHDERIKAAVVAAPGLVFSFDKRTLAAVHAPVQLWRAEFDHVLPAPDDALRKGLPSPVEYHQVFNADHYDFLAPCPAVMAATTEDICRERPGFDRTAFHRRFDQEVVGFFQQNLK